MRMPRIAALGAAGVMLTAGALVMAGCGSEQVNNAASTAPDGVETFTSGDTAVNVALGAKFVISLPETAGTGYQWKPAGGSAAATIVDLFDDAFVRTWRLYLAGSLAAFRAAVAASAPSWRVVCRWN